MIDKTYFEVRPAIYFRDLLIPTATFVASFVWCLSAGGWWFVVAYVSATVSIHRAGVFGHEISHRYDNRRLKTFNTFWDLTIGAVILLPAARFIKPHRIHHATGTFRTKDDPQYLLLRTDPKLAAFVLLAIPFIMPIFNLVLVVGSSLGGVAAEEAVERFLLRRGMTAGSVMSARHKRQVSRLSRYYLVVAAAYAVLMPETLPLMYAVQVGGWTLTTLRIPLEHGMASRLEKSTRRDHVADSFTIESPLAELLQPLSLKYHTAHHIYPGVPYHNLAALHADLKTNDPEYRRSVLTFREAVRGGPAGAPTTRSAGSG